jgi:hypothetical protein
MEIGAAVLQADWLDGWPPKNWQSKIVLWEVPT